MKRLAVIGALLVLFLGVAAVRAPAHHMEQTLAGKNIVQWHKLAVKHRRERDKARTRAGVATRALWRSQRILRAQGRRLATRPGGSMYAIRLASATFGVDYGKMVAVASCETGGDFSPYSYNRSSGASGLYQFLGGTWSRAGIAGFSVWDPVANALAAARLVVRDGGWSEWSCG